MNNAGKSAGGYNFLPDGIRIRELRSQRGWTQEELADQADVSKGTIERAEKGDPLRPGTLKQIADALKVPMETILPDCDPDTEPCLSLVDTVPIREVPRETRWDDTPPPDNPAASDPPKGQGEEVPVNGSSQLAKKVEITLRIDFDDFSPKLESALLAFIKETTGLPGEIQVVYRWRAASS